MILHAHLLRIISLVTLILAGLVPVLLLSTPASAATVPVTVTITRFIEIEDPDPTQGDGDYYSRVQIGPCPAQTSGESSGEDIEPFWTFTCNVDNTVFSSVTISIEIYDADGFGAEPDDVIDLNPADNVTQLVLTLDLATGDWTGTGIAQNQSFVQGDGDHEHFAFDEGGEAGKAFFTVASVSASGDADGDSLLDGWELKGLDADGDGTIDVDLPGFGADPLHKDLFLELDWMSGFEPDQADVQAFKAAFAAAPITAGGTTNPDGLPGINLWVDTGGLMEGGSLVGDNLGGGNAVPSTPVCSLNSTFYDLKGNNFDAARKWIFRYSISANNTGCDTGGQGEIGGNDFVDLNDDGGTLMHEFGHNLNLRHGGNVNANCKPNYVSVMNYDDQFNIRQADGTDIIDYSPPRFSGGRGAAPLANIVENGLNETTILDSTDAANQFVFVDATGQKVRSQLNQPVDWNGDGDTSDSGLTVNVDTSDASSDSPEACENGSNNSTLGGHDDWSVISLGFRQFGDSDDGAINPVVEHEMTTAELLELEEELHTTDLQIEKSDSVDPATAGLNLSYTLTVTNNGPNPADNVQVVDTLPADITYVSDDAGCVQSPVGTLTCDLGTLQDDDVVAINVTVSTPADLVYNNGDPKTITNQATVSSQAEFAQDSDATNNSVSEDTLVKAVADLEIVSFAEDGATVDVLIGQPSTVTLAKTITNHGPSAPMNVAVSVTTVSSTGLTVTADPANPTSASGVALDEQRPVNESFTLTCDAPGDQTVTFSNTISPLDSDDTDPNLGNNSKDVTLIVECVVPVAINIHPGSFENPINLRSKNGNAPVVVLTTEVGEYGLPMAFDATQIDATTVLFGPEDALFNTLTPSGAPESHVATHLEDSLELDEVTLDGDTDGLLHFDVPPSGLEATDAEACVKGEFTTATGDTFTFFGCDSFSARP